MIYLLDSNCFITSARFTYPFDVAESFWLKLSEAANKHLFKSIDKVKSELDLNADELSQWCSTNLPKDFFINTQTDEVYVQYGKLVNCSNSLKKTKGLLQKGVDKFIRADKADIFFVALALSSENQNEYTIVTEETSAVDSKKDIKLPDACSAHNIRTINFIQMFRELKLKF